MMAESKHLSNERLSSLLAEGDRDAAAAEHLGDCARCRRELELLRRMRMALSAMGDLEAPSDGWDRIEAELDRRTTPRSVPGDARSARTAWTDRLPSGGQGWLRAAAAVVLFVGGLMVGTRIDMADPAGAGGADDAARPTASAAGEASGVRSGPDAGRLTTAGDASRSREASIRGALAELEGLRASGPSPEEAYRNLEAAAEHLARLDALLRATREALEEDPADPAVNDLLFEVVEERQALNQALHLASLDYR